MPNMNLTNAGFSDGLMYSGLSGRSIHFSDLSTMPGPGTGAASAGTIQPALTSEAPRPVRRASTRVTVSPSRAR